MLSKIGSIALILAVTAGCATGGGPAEDSPGSPLIKVVSKNQSFVTPLDDAHMNGGYLLRVDLRVQSGQIARVDFKCQGKDVQDSKGVCPHVFACPATGRCGPDHTSSVTIDGNEATWWGWTDAGMADDANLRFEVHFTGAEPPPAPPC
jgi:hypothetical protein